MLKWPIWIGVVCEDLEAQRTFYRDTLGLREAFRRGFRVVRVRG